MIGSIFDAATGKILRVINAPEDILTLQVGVGEDLLMADSNDALDYVVNGIATSRPTQVITLSGTTVNANGVDTVTISNAPIGATFTAVNTVTNETVTGVIDGIDSFSTGIEGVYEISITLWPYLDFEATVNAI